MAIAERKDFLKQVEQLGEYETVAASQTAQALGATGVRGDYLSHIIIVPESLSPGDVAIKDGADGAITVFSGGASSLLTKHSWTLAIGLRSRTGGWQITTGAAVHVLAAGNFS